MNAESDMFQTETQASRHSRNLRLGWFVAGAIVIAIMAMSYMAVQKGLFKRTAQLHCLVDSAKGMSSGMAVKLNGFRIGSLENLAMDVDGQVSMVLAVNEDYVRLIHKDARARLGKEGLIGESVIDILPGSDAAPVVENNAVLAFERARDPGEELSKLAEQLQPILTDVKNITAYLDSPEGDIKKSLVELRRGAAAFADASEGASDLTHSKQIQKTLAGASSAMSTLDASLPRLIGKLDTSLHHIEVITSVLEQDLPATVSESRDTIHKTNEIVDAVKGSWPVKNLLPAQDEQPLPLDSHVPLNR